MAISNNNGFTFKQFFVAHDKSPMKVTTDSVLLGAWVKITPASRRVLDLGTGCGVIALMLAQRSALFDCQIDAIDIDEQAVIQSQQNIANSPFKKVRVIHQNVIDFAAQHPLQYELIVSNPPYFEPALACRNLPRQHARHTVQLTHAALLDCATSLLVPEGELCLVLPVARLAEFELLAMKAGWYIVEQLRIRASAEKRDSLVLLRLTRQAGLKRDTFLCIRYHDHRYTPELFRLTRDFYLFFGHETVCESNRGSEKEMSEKISTTWQTE